MHDFTITKGDATTATLQIDCSNIYATARTGYTYGTFTLASVTLQGSIDSVYVEAASGGSDYYKAGTAATYYEAGTAATYYEAGTETKTARGESVTVTLQGSSVTVYPRGTVHYYVRHTASETPTGAWYTRQSSKPASGTVYNVEYDDSSSSKTYYDAGSSHTYYRGNGGSFTVQGASVSVTPVGSAVSVTPIDAATKKHLLAATRYKGGNTVTDTYYTKS